MDHSTRKPSLSNLSPPPPRHPYRRRRIIWAIVCLLCLVFFFGAPWEFPAEGFGSISRANIAHLVKPGWVPDEIFGLLHFVTRDDGRVLAHDTAVDPKKPIKFSVFEKKGNWTQLVQALEEKYPVIVFSKTYCSYSKKAKALLETYDLIPPPKIVEVDLREDGDLVKLILGRLTTRSTFPNVFLHGKSLGGSDDIQTLHNTGKLKPIFEEGGVRVLGNIP
jgi:glutaredoxin